MTVDWYSDYQKEREEKNALMETLHKIGGALRSPNDEFSESCHLTRDIRLAEIAANRDIAIAPRPMRWCVIGYSAGFISGIGATLIAAALS